jgi:hypothetical protein
MLEVMVDALWLVRNGQKCSKILYLPCVDVRASTHAMAAANDILKFQLSQ